MKTIQALKRVLSDSNKNTPRLVRKKGREIPIDQLPSAANLTNATRLGACKSYLKWKNLIGRRVNGVLRT